MKKWEYEVIRISDETVIEINGEKTASFFDTKPKLHEFLNRRGREGWEMVGTISGKTSYYCRVILKRQLEESSTD